MGSPNLNLVRSIVAAWERGDFSSVGWADPNIEFRASLASVSVTGVPAMAEAWREWLREWDDFRLADVEGFRELDHELVLVLHSFTASGKGSGLRVEQTMPRSAMLFRVRHGKVTGLRLFSYDRDRTLVDLGLQPGGGARS